MKNVCGPAQRFDMTSARHCLWKKEPGSFQRLGTVIFDIREQQQQDMLTSQKERSGDQAAAYSAKSKRFVLERRKMFLTNMTRQRKGQAKELHQKNQLKETHPRKYNILERQGNVILEMKIQQQRRNL